jgi:hypothetical protein
MLSFSWGKKRHADGTRIVFLMANQLKMAESHSLPPKEHIRPHIQMRVSRFHAPAPGGDEPERGEQALVGRHGAADDADAAFVGDLVEGVGRVGVLTEEHHPGWPQHLLDLADGVGRRALGEVLEDREGEHQIERAKYFPRMWWGT